VKPSGFIFVKIPASWQARKSVLKVRRYCNGTTAFEEKGQVRLEKAAVKAVPEWVEYSAHEAEEFVAKMGKEGQGPAAIGMALRDTYGIPSVQNLCGKSITEILAENGVKMAYPRICSISSSAR